LSGDPEEVHHHARGIEAQSLLNRSVD
jgi:hypothetical protein